MNFCDLECLLLDLFYVLLGIQVEKQEEGGYRYAIRFCRECSKAMPCCALSFKSPQTLLISLPWWGGGAVVP